MQGSFKNGLILKTYFKRTNHTATPLSLHVCHCRYVKAHKLAISLLICKQCVNKQPVMFSNNLCDIEASLGFLFACNLGGEEDTRHSYKLTFLTYHFLIVGVLENDCGAARRISSSFT